MKSGGCSEASNLPVMCTKPAESLHEKMISEDHARRTFAFDDHYVIASHTFSRKSIPVSKN